MQRGLEELFLYDNNSRCYQNYYRTLFSFHPGRGSERSTIPQVNQKPRSRWQFHLPRIYTSHGKPYRRPEGKCVSQLSISVVADSPPIFGGVYSTGFPLSGKLYHLIRLMSCPVTSFMRSPFPFPSPMHPEPLIGIFADHRFKRMINKLGVSLHIFLYIAGMNQFKWFLD